MNVALKKKELSAKMKLHPVADAAQRVRKAVGDKTFPAIADKMIQGVKRNRESRTNEKAMYGSFDENNKYTKPTR